MTEIPTELLRSLVREAVRDAVATAPEPAARSQAAPGAEFATHGERRRQVTGVRIATDADLAAFVRQLMALFDNPRARDDIRNGWHRFSLTNPQVEPGKHATATSVRVERGVLTERQVADAAEHARSIVAAPGVVITPLARDKARKLGVHIEKERR